jgi:hypothetical protein
VYARLTSGPPGGAQACCGLFWQPGLGASGEYRIREGDEITLEPLRPRTFDKDSPVTAYWLKRCDGFQVTGRRGLTTVERAVYDDDPLHPTALEVHRARRGTKLVPIEAVEAVSPLRRVIYLRRRRSASARAVGGVTALAAYGRRAVLITAGSATAMWAYGAPRVRASARAGAGAAREQWPAVRQGGIAFGKSTVMFAAAAAAFVAAASVAAARFVRLCYRLLAPYAVRLGKTSFAFAGRALRSLRDQGAREIARVKRPQVVQPLPHTHELHGQPELLRDRDRDSALGGAVELR